MEVLGVEIDVNLSNMTDLEKYLPVSEKFAKDLMKTPLRAEAIKINALKCSKEEKERKLQALGTEKTLESFRYMFDVAKTFISTVTDNNGDVMEQLGDNLPAMIGTAKTISEQIISQMKVLSKEINATTEALNALAEAEKKE